MPRRHHRDFLFPREERLVRNYFEPGVRDLQTASRLAGYKDVSSHGQVLARPAVARYMEQVRQKQKGKVDQLIARADRLANLLDENVTEINAAQAGFLAIHMYRAAADIKEKLGDAAGDLTPEVQIAKLALRRRTVRAIRFALRYPERARAYATALGVSGNGENGDLDG